MKIISLLENTTDRKDLEIEHGLSLYIETKDKHILFDMGQTDLFAKNAEKLGVDLSGVDFAVLSHGHYDHGGGLETFFKINHTANVYVTKYAFEPHYHGKEKYIGLDKEIFNKYRDRFIITKDENNLGNGISIFTCNNNPLLYRQSSNIFFVGIQKNREQIDKINLKGEDYKKCDFEFLPDDFRHEQYLFIEGKQSVLFSGCSHKGILNILAWCNPDILIGGFHFKNLDLEGEKSEVNKKVLKNAGDIMVSKYKTKYYTCHCTGAEQYNFLKTIIKDRLDYFSTGMEIDLDI